MSRLVFEVIVCSVADALEAESGGASRLEVIRDLDRGGLTAPMELVQDILEAVRVPVRVMLRDNDSYEVAARSEIEKLCDTARKLSELGVGGLVLGFLLKGNIDVQVTESVLSCAPNLKATFHHAFEAAEDPLSAIKILKRVKQVDRILVSGGLGEWPERVERLSRYKEAAGPEIKILAGGGMDLQSIKMLGGATEIREFHVGRAAREPASVEGVVRAERVRRLVETAEALCGEIVT